MDVKIDTNAKAVAKRIGKKGKELVMCHLRYHMKHTG